MMYPKVLLINAQSMMKNNATGITMRSIWGDWPKNKLMEIFLNQNSCENDNSRIVAFSPKHRWARNLAELPILTGVNSKLKNTNNVVKDNVFISNDSFNLSKITMARQLFVEIVDSIDVRLSSDQVKKIEEFCPQVIYTLGGSVSTINLVYKLSKKLNIPVIFHYMDNWPEHLQWENNPLLLGYKKRLQKVHEKCLKRSKVIIGISPAMKNAYEKKYGLKCHILMNSVNPEQFKCSVKGESLPLHIVYAGGLHLERWKALKDIAVSIRENSISAILDIYTAKANFVYQDKFEGLKVCFHEFVPHDKIKEVYENSDLLVHCEVHNEVLSGFFKYSISTKIPEYLATGKPVLFYGPKEMGLYDYLSQNKVCYVAYDPKSLSREIVNACNKADMELLKKNAENLIENNHSIERTKRVLIEVINKGCRED